MAAPSFVNATIASDTGASVSASAPSGLASGDHQLIITISGTSGGSYPTISGFTRVAEFSGQPSGDDSSWRGAIFTASSSTTTGAISITNPNSSRLFTVARAAWRGGDGWLSSPAPASATTSAGTSYALPTQATTAADQVVVGAVVTDTGDGASLATTFTMPSPWTERLDDWEGAGFESQAIGIFDVARTASGTQSGTVTASRSDVGWVFAATLAADTSTPTAPTVSAGADVTGHVIDTEFTRTATESTNGATITSRAWTIQAGPTGVGTTIGTAAALSWTPTVTGTYTLRYAATNSVGTGTDDMSIQVVAAPVAPGSVFDLSRWHITLPTEDPGPDTDAAQIDQPELATYTDENFYVDGDGNVVFNAPVNGFTTSGESGATRCELREHEAGSYANSAWDPLTTGRRQLTVCCRVDGTSIDGTVNGTLGRRQEVIFFQIHGATGTPPIYLTAEWTSSGNAVDPPRVRMFVSGSGLSNANLVSPISPTADIAVRCRVEDATLKLWCVLGTEADLPAIDTTPTFETACSNFNDLDDWYFKHGSYNKTTIESGSTGEAVVTTSFLELLQPGDAEGGTTYDRSGAAAVLGAGSGALVLDEHEVYARTGGAAALPAGSGASELDEHEVLDRAGAAAAVGAASGARQRVRSFTGAAAALATGAGSAELDEHDVHDRTGQAAALAAGRGAAQLDEPAGHARTGQAAALAAGSGTAELDAVAVYDRTGAAAALAAGSVARSLVRSLTGAVGALVAGRGAQAVTSATAHDRTGGAAALAAGSGTANLAEPGVHEVSGGAVALATGAGTVQLDEPAEHQRSGSAASLAAGEGLRGLVRSFTGGAAALVTGTGAAELDEHEVLDRRGAASAIATGAGSVEHATGEAFDRTGRAVALAAGRGSVAVTSPAVHERTGGTAAIAAGLVLVEIIHPATHQRAGAGAAVLAGTGRGRMGGRFHAGRPYRVDSWHAAEPIAAGRQHAAAPYATGQHHAGPT